MEHKLSAETSWESLTVPAGSGAADIPGYSSGDEVDICLFAIATDGITESAASPVATIVIGAADPALPGALDAGSILITGGLGFAQIALATSADAALSRIQIYRAATSVTLNTSTHAVGAPFGVALSTTVTTIDGDATRTNLLRNSAFDDASDLTLGAGWAVSGGLATHTAGTAGAVSQSVSLTARKTYRGRVGVGGLTAGDLTPQLTGRTDQMGSAITADGDVYFALDAVSGNTEFAIAASTDCDASIDNLILFLVTANSMPQGAYDYYFEPQNSVGGAGPVAGPVTTTIT